MYGKLNLTVRKPRFASSVWKYRMKGVCIGPPAPWAMMRHVDGAPVSHTYQTTGSYTVTLTVTDSTGQKASTSQTVTVVSPAPPPLTTSFTYSPSTPDA